MVNLIKDENLIYFAQIILKFPHLKFMNEENATEDFKRDELYYREIKEILKFEYIYLAVGGKNVKFTKTQVLSQRFQQIIFDQKTDQN